SVNVFLDIVSTPLIEVENIVEIFSSYLNKSNLLDEDTLEKFYNCTFDYNRDYSDEEYEKKEEEYIDNESMSDFEYLIEHISEKIGFEIKSADFSDIVFYFDDVDYEFKELHESNRELFEEYKDYQDPASAFFESYGECATVYLFQDFKLSERLVDIVNFKIPVSYNGGLQTEIFTRGNNTYLTISDSFNYEPINREFLATLLCSLIKGGKYNVN
ncbi:MAG: hypothetical protein GX947_10125, partial [Tissierellia bacterium]|nr:hypothetical protein [Tissierellia bacterium]